MCYNKCDNNILCFIIPFPIKYRKDISFGAEFYVCRENKKPRLFCT